MKNLVIFNANDPQLPQVDTYLRTLFDKRRGAYDGDCVLISTKLSGRVRTHIQSMGCIIFEEEMEWLYDLRFWKTIAAHEILKRENSILRQHMKENNYRINLISKIEQRLTMIKASYLVNRSRIDSSLHRQLRREFDLYLRKHFSKLNIFAFLESSGESYDNILLTDADMVFQKPVEELLGIVEPGNCYVGDQCKPLVEGNNQYRSNQHARKYEIHKFLRYGPNAHEVNVGIVLAEADTMLKYLHEWQFLMFNSNLEGLFCCHPVDFWHEQDFFRLLRDMHSQNFVSVDHRYFVHAIYGQSKMIKEIGPLSFEIEEEPGLRPYIVHFPGDHWKRFPSVKKEYERTLDDILP